MPIIPIIIPPGRLPACPCWAPLFPEVYRFCDPRLPMACAPPVCCPQRPPQPVRPVPPIGVLPPQRPPFRPPPGPPRPPVRPGRPR